MPGLLIQPSNSLRNATELVKRYLQAGDSLHLAAALEWGGPAPQGQVCLPSTFLDWEAHPLPGTHLGQHGQKAYAPRSVKGLRTLTGQECSCGIRRRQLAICLAR